MSGRDARKWAPTRLTHGLPPVWNRWRRGRTAAAGRAKPQAAGASAPGHVVVPVKPLGTDLSTSLFAGHLTLSFDDLAVEIPDPLAPNGRREVLHGVSGSFSSGKVRAAAGVRPALFGRARVGRSLTGTRPQLVALMGPSGAGKTTLLNALAARVPLTR